MAVDPRRLVTRAFSVTILGVAAYYAVWGGEYSVFDLGRLAEQQRVESARLVQARAEVDSLRQLIDRLESDPGTIEAVARERFGMVREGEVLYRFVDAEPQAAESPTP